MKIKKYYQFVIACLFLATSAVWAQTTPPPQLPETCPGLNNNSGAFNAEFWQINLQPLANDGQLQTNTNITQMPNSTFQSAIWANNLTCNYNSASQGNFSLQSKFNAAAPQQTNPHWNVDGYVVICTSTDPKDCAFQATMMIPKKTPLPSDLQLQQPQDSLPHVPTDN